MESTADQTFTMFEGHRKVISGLKAAIVLEAKRLFDRGAPGLVMIFDDSSGRTIDFDLRGSEEQVLARVAPRGLPGESESAISAARGRGRPSQGVVGKEVTLLPRHWDWLASQPGGASAAIRRLVEDARLDRSGKEERRKARERAYYFMSAMAGDMSGFEEASRALFADDAGRFEEHTANWPKDVRSYANKLAFGE